jgi:hypothetical protein
MQMFVSYFKILPHIKKFKLWSIQTPPSPSPPRTTTNHRKQKKRRDDSHSCFVDFLEIFNFSI